jgi:hypothetical protein
MKNENLESWKKNIFDAIKDVSDIEFQKHAWLGKTPEIISSYIEVIAVLYDNSDFDGYIRNYESINGEDKLYNLFIELDTLMTNYNSAMTIELKLDDQTVLQDPKWVQITLKAKEILNLWQ